jgi:hypothetical protein
MQHLSQGQTLPVAVRDQLAGPVVLPSHFLRSIVASFQVPFDDCDF